MALGTSFVVGSGVAFAANKAAPQTPTAPLPAEGQKLEASYAAMLADLRSQITAALPKINDQQKDAYLKAHATELAAEAKLDDAQKSFADLNKASGLIGHAHWWIKDSENQIAKAQELLKNATADADRDAAQKTITIQTNRRDAGIAALKEREEALVKAKQSEPELTKNRDAAKAVLAEAHANSEKALDALNPKTFMGSNVLDSKLIRFEVLFGATPRGLAEFASQGPEQEALVNKLLADEDLVMQMLLADGPNGGKFGQAMQIYTDIQNASPKAAGGNFQRMALAIALEFAVPLTQKNPSEKTDAPSTVDPVKRYLAYEKAFLDGELDAAFKDLTTWEYRYALNDASPDEIMAWGRQMLHNYRPDEVAKLDYRWRYVESVKTEVQYGSQNVKDDRASLQEFQNIISNGGVCGRRAWFGGFILRAFGIPAIAHPQPGHAAIAHWTPKGWVINLGAGWGSGSTKLVYGDDLNFLEVSQAREVPEAFIEVQRAKWISDVLGEKWSYGMSGKDSAKGFWNVAALGRRQEIIKESKSKTLEAVGTDLGEANESAEKEDIKAVKMTDADRQVTVGADGVINIPAVASSKPTNSTGRIRFMPSKLGGMQLHYQRTGAPEDFEYTFDAPADGKYALTSRVVTTSADQHLFVAANGASEPTDIAVPYTVGMWDKTPAVEVTLTKGKNVLRFSRKEPVKGLTIKDFTLTPVK